MSQYILVAVVLVLVVSCFTWNWVSRNQFVVRRMSGADAIAGPVAGAIAVTFGLFISFAASDVLQRSRELHSWSEREASVARSILNFCESVGPSSNFLRRATIEYLQSATSVESVWLMSSQVGNPPGQAFADGLMQNAAQFAIQSSASDSLKGFIVTKVDELRQARTQRLNVSRATSPVSQWIAILIMAVLTQLAIALVHVGKQTSMIVSTGLFTTSAISTLLYLGWVDGLIRGSRIPGSLLPLQDLLRHVS